MRFNVLSKYVITGGYKLDGAIEVDSAKNAVLPILAGAIMCSSEVIINKFPNFVDVTNMCKILQSLGVKVDLGDKTAIINASNACANLVPVQTAKLLRSSIFTMGAMLARFRTARLAYPGGCDIGLRPINLHLKGLKDLGVKITENHGILNCDASSLRGGKVVLDFPSVGATENIMMCACLAKGKTTIINSAREPEIVDLACFLNKCGAKIYGAGTSTIEIDGVKQLFGCEYTPIPDRIIAGTYLIAAAITGGKIEVKGCNPQNFISLVDKLHNSGCVLTTKSDKIYLKSPKVLKSVGFIETATYPGFPTDSQAQMLALLTVSRGCSVVQENLFESRYKFVPELVRMGANVLVRERTAIVEGVPYLSGAEVYAKDLRGGASLVLAGLNAHGYTTVYDIHHIERGYSDFDKALNSLGASIKRVE